MMMLLLLLVLLVEVGVVRVTDSPRCDGVILYLKTHEVGFM